MKEPRKILFFRLDARVGDSIVHLFVLRELKKLFPSAHITVATFAPSEVFFEQNPYVDEVKVLPKLAENGSYLRPSVLLELVYMVLHSWFRRYDLVILPHTIHSPLNRLYCRFLPNTLYPIYDLTCSIRQSYVKMLQRLGAQTVDTSAELFIPQEAQYYARQFLQEHHLQPEHFWVINPVGSSRVRNCSLAQIQALIQTVTQAGNPVVLLDYQNQFSALQPQCPRYTASSIWQTAALIEQAAAVVTVDTGIVHLADCFHKKMFVLYAADRYSIANNHLFWASCQKTTRFLQSADTVQDIPTAQLKHALETEFLHDR